MEQTLDRIKLLMEYNSLLTLTENVDKLLLNEQPQMNRFKSAISVIEKMLSQDRGFLRELQRIPIFSSANTVDDINKIIRDIRSGRKVLTKKESLDVIKSLSLNNRNFKKTLMTTITTSQYFDDLAAEVFRYGKDSPPDYRLLKKVQRYWEEIGLDPDLAENFLKKAAPSSPKISKGWQGAKDAFRIGYRRRDILNHAIEDILYRLPILKSFKNKRIYDRPEWGRIISWASVSSNRTFMEIIKDIRSMGWYFPISLAGEWVRRYVKLWKKLICLHIILQFIINLMDTPQEYEGKNWMQILGLIALDKIFFDWKEVSPSLSWVFPAVITYDFVVKYINPILDPIFRGGPNPGEEDKTFWDNVISSMKKLIGETEEEVKKQMEEGEASKENFVDNKIEKNSSSEKGFKTFLLAKGKKYESGSFLPAEGEYPPFGKDTEGKAYEFIDGKWQ